MALRAVRIYPGGTPESNVIGFSRRAFADLNLVAFAVLMDEQGYTLTSVDDNDEKPPGSISVQHFEVTPPLNKEDTRVFGELCCRKSVVGTEVTGPIVGSPYKDVKVYDNREQPANKPYGAGVIIAGNRSRYICAE